MPPTVPITDQNPSKGSAVLGPVVSGFGVAITVWVAWFITHVPFMGLHERTATTVVLAVWIIAAIAAGRLMGGPRAWFRGGVAGFISAALGLLLIGTRLDTHAPGLGALQKPSTLAIVGAFLALGVAIGALGGVVGALIRGRPGSADNQTWLGRMGLVTVLAIAPLLFSGGLVTSTNAGMAVPDWPNTYGANMFLYPLRPDLGKTFTDGMSYADVFLEHSHRLFGALVGLTAIALMVVTLVYDRRRWVKGLSVGLFLFVCTQGLLGGARVRAGNPIAELDNRWYSMAHGVLAQLVFGVAVALAVALTPTFRDALKRAAGSPALLEIPRAKLLRICATGAMHATVLQLVFGAMYRHLRAPHALYSHIGWSLVVLVMAMLGGIAATAVRGSSDLAQTLRRVGFATLAVVVVQWGLGWAAWLTGGSGIEAKTIGEALVRTAHQANGALFLALTVATWLCAKRALRAVAGGGEPSPVGVASPA